MNRFLQILCLSLIVFSLFACGGGGDTTNNTTNPPPTDPGNPPAPPIVTVPDIQDGYTLTATKIVYSSGLTVTEKDIKVFGKMSIYKDDIVQTVTIGNTTFTSDNRYYVDWNTEQTGGTIHLATSNGIHDISFTYNKTDKSISTYSGVITTNGVTFEEWDIWSLVMPTKASKSATAGTTITALDDFVFIGDHLQGGN